jgi:hypothetical protein
MTFEKTNIARILFSTDLSQNANRTFAYTVVMGSRGRGLGHEALVDGTL